MAKTGLVNISANNTFQVWLDRTNELVNIIGSDVLTASASPGDTTGSVLAPKVATLIGTFTANTITAETRLRTDTIGTTSTDITLEAPTVISSSQRVGLESFSNSANPVLRVNNNSVSWDIGFLDTSNFTINDGSGVERLKLTPAGDLTIAGSITTSTVTADIVGDVTGNLTGNVTGNVTGNLTGNADTASELATPRTISLSGAVTGSASFNGSSNITIAATATSDPTLTLSGDATGSATFTNLGNATLNVTVVDDSHNHVISNIDNLQTTLDGKASNTTQSTGTWQAGTSTTETIVSPAKVKAAIETLSGFGQTWNVFSDATRLNNEPYRNGDDRPISVSVMGYSTSSRYFQVSSDSINWINLFTIGGYGNVGWISGGTAVVPEGWYYKTSGSITSRSWAELR